MNICPDDLEDFREESTQIILILEGLKLTERFSRNAVGSTFYKVAAVQAVRQSINLESFLDIGEKYYTSLVKMLSEIDNQLLNDLEQENQNGEDEKN